MSVEGGLFRSLERGVSVRCATIQLFTKNSSQWAARELTREEIRMFRKIRRESGIHPVFAHCSYLINLAAPNDFYEKSIQALIVEIQRGKKLGLNFVVLHPGAHVGRGEEEGLARVVAALNRVIA